MYKIIFLLTVISTNEAIKCFSNINSMNGLTECSSGWCKSYFGGSGKLEQACDLTGDCRTCGYDPYINEIRYCVGNSGRKTCCCNTDFCNSTTKSFSLLVVAMSGVLTILYAFEKYF